LLILQFLFIFIISFEEGIFLSGQKGRFGGLFD